MGAGDLNGAFNSANKAIESVPYIGKAVSLGVNYANPVGLTINAAKGIDRGVAGQESANRAPGEARAAAEKAKAAQAAQAADIKQNMLIQPKQVTPDNFLANKANQLANLRLGMASTIVGSAKAPGAAGASLTGDYPGKKTLGS